MTWRGGELEFLLADAPYDQPAPEWRRPMVVVVPGGGYWMVSKREKACPSPAVSSQ